MTTKAPNYTEAQTTDMVARYTAVRDEDQDTRDDMVLELAMELGKTERSIRAKLSREDVYIAKTVKSTVTGEVAAKKIDMAERLIKLANVKASPENVAKMNKLEIQAFINAFEALQPEADEADEADAAEEVGEAS